MWVSLQQHHQHSPNARFLHLPFTCTHPVFIRCKRCACFSVFHFIKLIVFCLFVVLLCWITHPVVPCLFSPQLYGYYIQFKTLFVPCSSMMKTLSLFLSRSRSGNGLTYEMLWVLLCDVMLLVLSVIVQCGDFCALTKISFSCFPYLEFIYCPLISTLMLNDWISTQQASSDLSLTKQNRNRSCLAYYSALWIVLCCLVCAISPHNNISQTFNAINIFFLFNYPFRPPPSVYLQMIF